MCRGSSDPWGEWGNAGGCGQAGTSAVSCVVRFSSAAVSWGRRGRSHGHLSGWWVGAPGPTSVAASLGTAETGRLDSRVTLLLLLGVPGLPAPRPQLENRIAGSAPALPSVPPPVWVPVHPLNAHCVGFSASWGVGQRHLCFVVHVYRLWMEGERQRPLFAPPSPQVPVLCPESADSV